MFGSPMRVDTVPPVALEDVIALWADARWFSFELSLAAQTGLLHSDLLKPPTMIRRIRIRAGSAHFYPYNTPSVLLKYSRYTLPFQSVAVLVVVRVRLRGLTPLCCRPVREELREGTDEALPIDPA
jgi:hypothetical protein